MKERTVGWQARRHILEKLRPVLKSTDQNLFNKLGPALKMSKNIFHETVYYKGNKSSVKLF